MFTFVNDTSYDICHHQDNLLHFGLTTKLTFLSQQVNNNDEVVWLSSVHRYWLMHLI